MRDWHKSSYSTSGSQFPAAHVLTGFGMQKAYSPGRPHPQDAVNPRRLDLVAATSARRASRPPYPNRSTTADGGTIPSNFPHAGEVLTSREYNAGGMRIHQAWGPDRRMLWALGAATWTLLYVASKVHYASEELLGVTGGPHVPASHYADYGPGEVAAAQWANAAVGLLIVLLFALCALPLTRRLPRILLSVLVGLVALGTTAGAVGMLGRAALTDSGGAAFGGYCLVWAVLSAGVLVALIRGPHPRRYSPQEKGSANRTTER